MEDKMFNNLFGPLSKQYCIWFYWLSVLGFIFLILTIVSGLIMLVSQKKFDGNLLHSVVLTAIMYAIFYFQNRLLYSMCIA